MTFVRRRIDIKFQLGQGDFGEGGFDTIELKGLRASVEISTSGDINMASCSLRVWGVSLKIMNALSILGVNRTTGRRNTVIISAGDDNSGVAVIFIGTISEAWIAAQGSPEVSFNVSALAGYFYALKPVAPVSFKGTVDAALVVRSIALQMRPEGAPADGPALTGLRVQNDGVSVQIDNPYLHGTSLAQLNDIAVQGNFNLIIENNVVFIWPGGGARGQDIPLINKDTGLVGYPDRTQTGIRLTTLFNPNLKFGQKIQVQSQITIANRHTMEATSDTPALLAGYWSPNSVSHELESELPGGKWFTTIECFIFGSVAPIAG